jgi:dipeptidyl aminopeptidase/acylaminoacyl peptidase
MQTDVIDGVRALIDQGIADPDRICIGGWSYGAYVALYAAVETPELFKCAFGVNGVYDLNAYSESFGQWDNFGYTDAARRDRWGDAAGDHAALAALSPTDRASEISIPVMVIGSEQDPIADVSQSRDLIAALRDAGQTPETLIFEEGDHSMGFGESRVETYEAMAEFMGRYLH